MSQRTLLIALAVVALFVLAGVATLISTGTFNLLGGENAKRPSNVVAAGGEDDPFAEQADAETPVHFDGTDEHGRYINGPNGEHIYIDSNGRRYILGPDGKRVYVDPQGRPVGPDGKPLKKLPGDAGGSENRSGSKTGNGAEQDPAKQDDKEEAAKPAELSGQVVDDSGNAYEGAHVTVQVTGGESRKAATDENGTFSFADLPSETVLVLTASDDFGNSSKPYSTRLAPGPTKLKSPLVLPRDTAIRGVVRDAETGLPLDGAQVVLFSPSNLRDAQASQSADLGGAFAFLKLLPGGYRIEVSRSGYAPRILNSVEPPSSLIVEMSPGAVITGSVSDTGGNPIAGAQVSCDFRAEPAQYFHTEALSDELGKYVVKCQPESQHNTVTVLAAGYHEEQKTLVKSGSVGIDFTMRPMTGVVLVRGRLLLKSGAPVTTATFTSYDADGKYRGILQRSGPNADGRFWCGLDDTAAELRLRSPPLAELRIPINAGDGGEIDLGDLYMDTGYTVFGVITRKDEPETKIENATVTVGAAKATSAKDGSYRIEGLSAEEFIVRVLHAAYLGTAVRVTPTPGQYEIELNLELSTANFDARVHVTDAQTSQPLEGVKITLSAYGQTLFTDAEGNVHVEGLSSMKVDARIEKQGYATVNTSILADQPSKTAEKPPQEIALLYGNTIHGVCTSNGAPLPAASKVEIWGTSKLEATVYTDTEGSYSTESLPVGQYFVAMPEYHYAARAVELTEEGAEFDIALGAICHLRGKLLRANGQPHANAGIYIYRRDNVYWTATAHSGPDGKYEVTNLFPGDWVFCALKTQGDTAAQFAVNVNVTNAGWNDVDVQLPAITGVVTGRITYPSGLPVKKARVAVTNLTANFPRALLAAYVVTDDDGNYTAERLENGAQMQVRVGGYQDEAQTGTAFSEVLTIPSDSSPVEANFVVAEKGVTVRASMHRADGGPIMSGGPLCYLYDEQGRLSGLYFGGGTYNGHIDMYDVVPGTYTLVVCNRGMKKAEVQFSVGTEPISTGIDVVVEPEDRSSGE